MYGAIQTPCILQSGINCGDKMFDHAGLTFIYSKLVKETPITTPYDGSGNFTLNANLKIINEKSGRYIYNVSGVGPTNDVNRAFDFTGWASSHPGEVCHYKMV